MTAFESLMRAPRNQIVNMILPECASDSISRWEGGPIHILCYHSFQTSLI